MSVKGAEKVARVGEATAHGNLAERVVGCVGEDLGLVETAFDEIVDRTFAEGGEEEPVEGGRRLAGNGTEPGDGELFAEMAVHEVDLRLKRI